MNPEDKIQRLQDRLAELDREITRFQDRMGLAGRRSEPREQSEIEALAAEHQRAESDLVKLKADEIGASERSTLEGAVSRASDDIGKRLSRLKERATDVS